MQDFHTGGTVCSPTRATVLTGRNHFRDCVEYVYGCSDMTECVPNFQFAPQGTFTVGDAVRASGLNYTSHFGGKWHLGSLFNDSERFGGTTSSPITHGFNHMNCTVEVSPTATTNCQCNAEWQPSCNYGHYGKMTHCAGTQGPDPDAAHGCCFNYWWDDEDANHGISNFTKPTPDDDALYNADSFIRFLENQGGAPFLAQISFHNCHIPFVGTHERKLACKNESECSGVLPGAKPYSDLELDFYACLNELDNSVGLVLDALDRLGYYDNTMVWFTVDNGPEANCPPEGRCGSGKTGHIPPGTLHRPQSSGPGSAGPLRGRKRDVWEGGHRVPGVISWPNGVRGKSPRVSWDPVVTMDFLATVMDVLDVNRPAKQRDWHFDGVSVLPILRGEGKIASREIGWMYHTHTLNVVNGYAYRSGKWKYVAGGISCYPDDATFNCSKPQLYDMTTDYAEEHDVSAQFPDVMKEISRNFTMWYESIQDSWENESKCRKSPFAPKPFPKPGSFSPSSSCTFVDGKALMGHDLATGSTASKELCCGACAVYPECVASVFVEASPMRPTFQGHASGGTCHLRATAEVKSEHPGEIQTACILKKPIV